MAAGIYDSLTGKRFGKLIVLDIFDRIGKSCAKRYRCVCDCGTEKIQHRVNLLRGEATSCGSKSCRKSVRGSNNVMWSGGVKYRAGYKLLYLPEHPRAVGGYVREHILIAEKALGKYIDKKHPIHHVDGNAANNTNDNLVICENQGYHMILHARTRTVLAGGNPNTEKYCNLCKHVKHKSKFFKNRTSWDNFDSTCKDCRNAYRNKVG